MSKNAWITIVVIIVIVVIGWAVYAAMDNDSMEMTDTTTPTNTADTGAGATATAPNDLPADTGLTSSPLPGDSTTVEFTVNARDFSYDVTNMTVKKGDTVKITLKDTVGMHDLKVEGYDKATPILNPGQSQVISFVADKAGDFAYYCTVGNHRQMGMVGTLHVLAK